MHETFLDLWAKLKKRKKEKRKNVEPKKENLKLHGHSMRVEKKKHLFVDILTLLNSRS